LLADGEVVMILKWRGRSTSAVGWSSQGQLGAHHADPASICIEHGPLPLQQAGTAGPGR